MNDESAIENIDPMVLSNAYDNIFHDVKENKNYAGYHKFLHAGAILRESSREVFKDAERKARSDCCVVNRARFEDVCQCIADGRGIVGVFPAGPKLAELKFGQVYSPPSNSTLQHAVVLIGAIFCLGRIIYIFLNSWGREFCAFCDENGNIVMDENGKIAMGGVGMVETSLSCNPIVLSRSWEKGASGRLSVSWRVDMDYKAVGEEVDQLRCPIGKPTFVSRKVWKSDDLGPFGVSKDGNQDTSDDEPNTFDRLMHSIEYTPWSLRGHKWVQTDLAEYHKLELDISELEKKIMSEKVIPESALLYLVAGRLVKVRDDLADWEWSVVGNVVKKPQASGTLLPASSASCSDNYVVDTLLHCSFSSSENGSRSKPYPPRSGEKGEMNVVPVPLPPDLQPPFTVHNLRKLYPQELWKLNPVKDMGIQEPELVDLLHKLEDLEQKKCSHPLSKSGQSEQEMSWYHSKAEFNHDLQQLNSKMRDSQLQSFRDELKNRPCVLKMLSHIQADGVLQLKGCAACLIDTGDELLMTELMFNGTFNDLDHHQVDSLFSCFVPCEKSSEQIHLRSELSRFMMQLQEAARKIAEVQRERNVEVNVEQYVKSSCKPT